MPTGESIRGSLYYLFIDKVFIFLLLFKLLFWPSWVGSRYVYSRLFFCEMVRIDPRDSSPVCWVLESGFPSLLFIIFMLSHKVVIYRFYIIFTALWAFFWFYLSFRYALSRASPESLRLNSDTPVNNFSSFIESF